MIPVSVKNALMALLLSPFFVSCGYSGPYVGTLRQVGNGNTAAQAASEINEAITTLSIHRATASVPNDYRLGPEDLIEITIFNVPPSEVGVTPRTSSARINQNGMIILPLLGEFQVVRLTADDLRQLLERRYDQYIHNPEIGVRILEHHNMQVSVLGAVKNPEMFELTSPKTVIDMLAMARGIASHAGTKVYLHRKTVDGRETYVIDLLTLTSNPNVVDKPVYAGDVIHVPDAEMFYIDGAVRKPGPYPLVRRYTLTQAIAHAGGLNRELSDTDEISIIRPNGPTDTYSLSYDFDEILAGKVADPELKADDVVVVPVHGFKYFVRRFVGGFSMNRWIPPPPPVGR